MQLRYVIGALAIVGALAAISVVTYYGEQEAYYTVDELYADRMASAQGDDTQTMQIRGEVDYASVERSADGLDMSFEITGKDARMPVRYHGIVPDTFDMAETVTVGGHVTADGSFQADRLYVQCPSKYEAEPPSADSDIDQGA